MRTRLFFCLFLVSLSSPVFADSAPEKLVVATWNLEWFFDEHPGDNYSDLAKQQTAPSREAWDWKLAGVAKAIAEMKPTILALQEIENRRVMFYLQQKLKKDYGLDYAVAFIEGDDYFTEQDVAVLVKSGLVGFAFKRQSAEMFASETYYNVSKHIFCLLEWDVGDKKIEVLLVNVHFRAMPDAVALRKRQAKLIRYWISDSVKAGRNVIVTGDINTNETYETTTNDGDLGILRGLDTPTTDDDLADLFEFYRGDNKETHLIHKQFDHILVTPSLVKGGTLVGGSPRGPGYHFKSIAIRRDLVIRGDQDKEHRDDYWKIPDAERDVSDHYPVVAEFELQR
jgi:endonuclease/exonuclease/phosphatase family metal-dependent hydrolase